MQYYTTRIKLCYSRKHRTGGSGVIHTEVNVARNTCHNAVNVLLHNRIKRLFNSLPAFLRPSVWGMSHTGWRWAVSSPRCVIKAFLILKKGSRRLRLQSADQSGESHRMPGHTLTASSPMYLLQSYSFTAVCPGLHYLSFTNTASPPPFLSPLSLVLSARSIWKPGSSTLMSGVCGVSQTPLAS